VLDGVLDALGLKPRRIIALKDIPLQNGSWLLDLADGGRAVLRRYNALATLPDLSYEHQVLGYLARTADQASSAGYSVAVGPGTA
jgi:hypothetical protein